MPPKPIPILMEEIPAEAEAGFGALSTPLGNLPLKAVEVQTRIDGLNFRTTMRQSFRNCHSDALEATYIFPLPDRAAVGQFRLTVAGRVVEGELQERAKAREMYEEAIKKGHRAAIAEEERPNVFTMRVGNLPPGEDAAVELVLTGALPIDHGEATWRFPLVVAPRYIPGQPLDGESVGSGMELDTDAVPDASRISPPVLLPGQPNPVRLNLSVEVYPAGLPVHDFRSSLHGVEEQNLPGGFRFCLKPGERLDRDFILRFRFDDVQLRTSLQTQSDPADPSQSIFALTVVPPQDSARANKPRLMVFVLDRSGSMQGWKMLAARRALGRMIDSLTDRDRFAILAFDDQVESFPPEGKAENAANRQRFRALEWLGKIESRGGTELARPLARAFEILSADKGEASPGVDRIVVLVTDGQVGNEDQILKVLADRLQGIRIFTLGIDQAVNDAFLRRLAGLGGGYSEVVESEERLDDVMDKVHRRIRTPLLTGLKLEGNVELTDVVPERLSDLFPGTPITILGRIRAGSVSDGAIRVRASDEAGQPWLWEAKAQPAETVAPVWARGFVRELEDRYAIGRGKLAEIEKRIVEVSLKYHVLCRFTAFVAVDVKEVVNPGGHLQRITQPVDPAAGWDMLKPRRQPEMMDAMCCINLGTTPPGWAAAALPTETESVDSMFADFSDPGTTETDYDVGKHRSEIKKFAKRSASCEPAALRRATPGLDLSAYRQRAENLRQRLEQATERLRELYVLAVRLEELIDDLKSINAPEAEWQPLADLLTELRTFLGKPKPSRDEIHATGLKCNEVLDAFSGAKKKAARNKAFWK
ncbi:MAG TPA: VIT domain-containing protein [Gemmataceae bacterium]|nr:VIT domain-containing protein [Gemmataceae bacterium]